MKKIPKIENMNDAIRLAKMILNESPDKTMIEASRIIRFLATQDEA
jgi:hypothetical protein